MIKSEISFTGNLLAHVLRIFLVHKVPFLKINCAENTSFVEILIQEEKRGNAQPMLFWNIQKKKKSETILHFKYAIRLGRQKKRLEQNYFFHRSDLNCPLSSKTTDLPTFETWYFVHFGIKMNLKNTLKFQNCLQSSRTVWCWALCGTELFSALQDQLQNPQKIHCRVLRTKSFVWLYFIPLFYTFTSHITRFCLNCSKSANSLK